MLTGERQMTPYDYGEDGSYDATGRNDGVCDCEIEYRDYEVGRLVLHRLPYGLNL